ncbi:ArsO family NAD(P)H-dependent flavin-containing monooxygenase [Corynebacterium senegalense]|uniref:ArsO family NAD(P)H-dependent flavin-containing monooxygenase n=1 Tax=Corynebacterium senegalense TaxID=2080750 RepID=UPI001FE6B767|nr:ArsO family NAD(P)H-dependent flavin-containing monooxygenase [Corynebacterium senegalense]
MAERGEYHQAIIVGGGQAGLATGYYLRKRGVDFLILDDQPAPGGAWRHVWPSMTLFSASEFSNLPGWPMPYYDGFPPAEHVVRYLTEYERRYALPVERPVRVEKVTHDGEAFRLDTSAGAFTADNVIAATGTWSAPFVPSYPGTFSGRQWHSANYPGVEPFRGARVAVVGAANSGAQIAAELTDVAEVTWYTRHEPRWMPDDVDGRVLFRRASQRAAAIRRGEPDPGPDNALGDIVVLPRVRAARDSGRLTATPMFGSLDEVDADHLIWCTGFRPAITPLRSLFDATPPGLFFVGYGDWTGPGSATLTGVGQYAREVAERVAGRREAK